MTLYAGLTEGNIMAIIKGFDIGDLRKYSPLSGGLANSNYLIETNRDKYVLTWCEYKSFEEAKVLADLLGFLDQQQFETSKIVCNKSNQNIALFQNKPILLKTYISGRVLEHLNKDQLVKLGHELGRLNQLTAPSYLPNTFPYGEQEFEKLYDRTNKHPFAKWLSNKHQYVKEYLALDLPKALVHGDVFPSNVIIKENDRPIIMDFEEACNYFRLFDLGTAIVGLCVHNGELVLEKAHALIEGYKSIIAMTDTEISSLKAFTVYAATALAFWRYRQFNVIYPNQTLKNIYKEMLSIADQVYEMPSEDLFTL